MKPTKKKHRHCWHEVLHLSKELGSNSGETCWTRMHNLIYQKGMSLKVCCDCGKVKP